MRRVHAAMRLAAGCSRRGTRGSCSISAAINDIAEHTDYLAIRAMPLRGDENYMGDIFGGYVLGREPPRHPSNPNPHATPGQMDLAAAIGARRFSHNKVVTVAVDKVVFKNPVHTGDTLSCYTSVLDVGRTSIKAHPHPH